MREVNVIEPDWLGNFPRSFRCRSSAISSQPTRSSSASSPSTQFRSCCRWPNCVNEDPEKYVHDNVKKHSVQKDPKEFGINKNNKKKMSKSEVKNKTIF